MSPKILLCVLGLVVAACTGSTTPSTTTVELTTTSGLGGSTTTSISPSTTTTQIITEAAWTENQAEKWVEGYLNALAAGAWEQAAWSAENNGIVFEDQGSNETTADYLERVCTQGACNGPYVIEAEGPGVVDNYAQASSVVSVAHAPSGKSGTIRVGTFEGQVVIADLPPLIESEAGPSLVEQLFGDTLPERVVIEQFNAFEIWEGGSSTWVTNWWANDIWAIEGDWAIASRFGQTLVVRLNDPATSSRFECPTLVSRSEGTLVLDSCSDQQWHLYEPGSGREIQSDLPDRKLDEDEFPGLLERGGTTVEIIYDSEGNATTALTGKDVDVLGDNYASLMTISADGSAVAFVDHRDPAAISHFFSAVVVVNDANDGAELGRRVMDAPVTCLQFSGDWVVACLQDPRFPMESFHDRVAAINVGTGEVTTVLTRSRVFLPS